MTELIAGPRSISRSALEGLGPVSDFEQMCEGWKSGDWVEGSLATVGFGFSALATVIDPIGTALSAGIGWCIEHFAPLKDALEWLTGDESQVAGFSDTWANIAARIEEQRAVMESRANDLAAMHGAYIDALRQDVHDAIESLGRLVTAATALSGGFEVASSLVRFVYEVTRDALADVVAKAIVWVTELILTLGLGTPVVIAQVTSTVADWAANLLPKIDDLLVSVSRFTGMSDEVTVAVRHVGDVLATKASRGIDLFMTSASRADTALGNADDAARRVTGLNPVANMSSNAAHRATDWLTVELLTPDISRRLLDHYGPARLDLLLDGLIASNARFADSLGSAASSITSVAKLRGLIAELYKDGRELEARELETLADEAELASR